MSRWVPHCIYSGAVIVVLSIQALFAQKYVENGVAIDFSASSANAPSEPVIENRDVLFRFRISEAASGSPINSRRLAAWIDSAGSLDSSSSCNEKVKGFLEGSFFYRPAADLNSYYVLTLNREPSISIVDPLVSYGETHELATVSLPSPGIDWVPDTRSNRILISLPESKKIAVVDTARWKVNRLIDVPAGHPGRILFQPDRQYFWVAWDSDTPGSDSGVAAFHSDTLAMAGSVVTGKGSHEIAFTGDSRFALVTNRESGDVAVIDVQKLSVVRREHTGLEPVSIDFSPLSSMAYVANQGDGTITAIGIGGTKTVTITADAGVGPVRFSPGGRLGFALNPSKNLVYIIDASLNRIVQTGDVEKSPDQIVFSNQLAYIRHRDSETVLMIPLAAAGRQGSAVHVADFPAGKHPLGASGRPNLADGIAQAPGENAVWVANPGDRMVYYYMEGMAAPKGSFVVAEEPRAVMVVDRSLQQTSPGVYETIARLPGAGKYEAAVVLDNPSLIHCFAFNVQTDPAKHPVNRISTDVKMLPPSAKPTAGVNTPIRLRFTDPVTGAPKDDLKDVGALIYLPPGVHYRLQAKPAGGGVYEIEFRPSEPGLYEVYVACPSLGLTSSSLPAWHLEVEQAAGNKQP